MIEKIFNLALLLNKCPLGVIGKFVTITELQEQNEEMANYSNQKLSALLKQLVDSNVVARQVDKKKAYFFAN